MSEPRDILLYDYAELIANISTLDSVEMVLAKIEGEDPATRKFVAKTMENLAVLRPKLSSRATKIGDKLQ